MGRTAVHLALHDSTDGVHDWVHHGARQRRPVSQSLVEFALRHMDRPREGRLPAPAKTGTAAVRGQKGGKRPRAARRGRAGCAETD